MNKFVILTSRCIPMRNKNVDTDQIIPARYLLMITKDGYGEHLFQDWRYNEDGSPKNEFILNKPEYKGAEILLAGENFGSGSSREHAVWAITQYGIKAVLAPSFSDIFTNNAYGNGLLVIPTSEKVIEELFGKVEANPEYEITIDLENQRIMYDDREEHFAINQFVKDKLIKGLDDIGYILDKKEVIEKFEKANNI